VIGNARVWVHTRMSFDEAKNEREVVTEAQAIVMKVLDCDPIEASETIRRRAETEERSVIDTARSIAAGGVANFH
jgi:AmiR/NasT family two-component response regulator